jgi:hypothetical protein
MAVLWSAEAMHAVRIHRASFAAICPDPSAAFGAWWEGSPLGTGSRSTLVVFDPIGGRRSCRARWIGLGEVAGARPRYRDYSDAAAQLRQSGPV